MSQQSAIVTGAGSGMGKLAAQRLTRAGWRVAAVDLPGAHLDEVAAQTGARPYACDVSDADQVSAVAAAIAGEFGAVHRLVNAAGIAVSGSIDELPVAEFARSMDVNYLGTVSWVKAVLPEMRSRRTGEIVLFASLAGWMPTPKMAAYTATKFAVLGFAETLAMELEGSGVDIRCVCPGAVQTPMLDDIMATGMPEVLKKAFRVSTPDQVLDAIDASLSGRHRGIYVFPGLATKATWRVRRAAPQLLGGVVRRLSA